MPKVKGYIDPDWAESNLIILILDKGSLQVGELLEKIREEQKKRIVLGEKDITHTKSAYGYWIKQLENKWIISRDGAMVELTLLGKWISNSKLGTFCSRADFVNLLCHECFKPADLVLLKPLVETAQTNSKGRLFMDVKCPRCQHTMIRMPMTENLAKDEFIAFYNDAVRELKRLVRIEAHNM